VPSIVEKCLAEIELRGLEEVGIYRVSGAAADVSRLRTLFNIDPDAVDLGSGGFHDINVVSGVIKQFLRELPEPLMTFNLYDGFINAASIDDYDERLWAIKDLVHALPTTNYTVLKRLVEHLERVTDYEEINHMYGTNLALVFGPSLLR
ncbi:RhoGAP-domain-containing protein, partial [Coemansia reversa NRRL 1564]